MVTRAIFVVEPLKAVAQILATTDQTSDLPSLLARGESKELIISLCGPAGCGIPDVARITTELLESLEYTVVPIKVSDLMIRTVEDSPKLVELRDKLPPSNCPQSERISKLQQIGNELRAKCGEFIGAALAIREISVWRADHPALETQSGVSLLARIAKNHKTAFLIDQLKNPAESILLNKVYGNTYYQLGVLATEEEKIAALMKSRIDRIAAVSLIEADRRHQEDHGQQLEKTLTHSDYFIHSSNLTSLKEKISRFLDLIHGKVGITPTNDEVGMNAAYTASLRSACLSRQVGAAICDKNGNVLSVGRNDVPKFGGGLYTSDDGAEDKRCVFYGRKCYNTEQINFLVDDLTKILSKYIDNNHDIADAVKSIKKHTSIGSLLEFSRAIHAEMDAITSIARNSSCSTKNTTIYTTTYPCHNCARHIVAAGITRVVYIEPYAKSLASSLHDDTIRNDSVSSIHVSIEPFEGVAPRRQKSFFEARSSRKGKDGKALDYAFDEPYHIDAVLVAEYTNTETIVAQSITDLLREADRSQPSP